MPVSSYFFIITPVIASPATPATGRVNNVLKPEKADQFEIGTKGTLFNNKLVYQLALFHTRFSDKMTSVSVPLNSTATAYSYVINGGEQDHKGFELALKYSIVKDGEGVFTNVTPFINFTYSDFSYGDNFIYKTGSTTANGGIDTLNYSGYDVFGVPKIMNAWGIDAATKHGIYGSFSHLYRDGVNIAFERLTNYPETYALRTASGYNLLNTKIGFKRSLSTHFDLDAFFGVDNITGVRYPIMLFLNQLPDAYIPAPPRAVYYGGVNLKYNL